MTKHTIRPKVQRWLDLLPIVAGNGWHETGRLFIRLRRQENDFGICPICALANEVLGEERYTQAAHTAR